jgi:hypothetical protein
MEGGLWLEEASVRRASATWAEQSARTPQTDDQWSSLTAASLGADRVSDPKAQKTRQITDGERVLLERIALAHRNGEALPPVVLRRQPDGYYVVDGRHRGSVAQALGHRDIDAWVSGPSATVASKLPYTLSRTSAARRKRSPSATGVNRSHHR